MISMKASEIASIVGGELHGGDVLVTAPAFLNSADCVAGSIFLAIRGENVDGDDFAGDAFAHGAVLAITSRKIEGSCVVVTDVTTAISALATHVRLALKNLTVIGITGSQGKTTTKELLSAILSAAGPTIAPQGNNNNELGVPITLLKCDEETRYCILEMGARHLGDIASLVRLARPNIGVVLRVAAAHLGEFGSMEAIAKTKSEMIEELDSQAIAILGQYDEFTPKMSTLHNGKILTFGEIASATIRATDIELRDGRGHFELVTPEGRATIALRQHGLHQIPNALAAAAVAHALNISTDHIAAALSTAEMNARWRMEVHELPDLTLVNDAYNASPDSMKAALAILSHMTQERGGESWAFVGNMRELGDSTHAAHQEITSYASELGIDHLVAVNAPDYLNGNLIKDSMVIHNCADKNEALKLAQHINRGDVVLCKASRSDKLEELANAIEEMWKIKMEREEESTQ
jgi:UDP-N-acetylmuramoyl-tripeptide--D-alanyl-D-alanine ligase